MANKDLINYTQFQEEVFQWLLKRNEQDPNFTFSTRLKGSQGAELNYFIGTEKSNYFGTTFWTVPVGFPGSAGDLIDVFFTLNEEGYYYYVEFVQTTAPEDDQNKFALELIKQLKNEVASLGSFKYETGSDNKMFKYELSAPRSGYSSLDEMLNDLSLLLDKLFPIVDRGIREIKSRHPEFIAHRITNDEFKAYTDKLYRRFEKYEHLNMYEASNTDFIEFLKHFEESELEAFFFMLREVSQRFQLQPGDERLVFNVHSRRGHLSFTVGQRYCLSLNPKEQRGHFGVISKDKLMDTSEPFSGNHPRPWFTYLHNLSLTPDQKENVMLAIETELNRSPKSGFRQYNKPDFETMILGKNKLNKKEEQSNHEWSATEDGMASNVILYGPPGTGKTFTLKKDYFPKYTTRETSITSDQHFESVVRELTWWQVIAIAVNELGKCKVVDIGKNEWVLKKAKLSNSNSVRPTIWGQLQSHTVETCEFVNVRSKQQPYIFNKSEDSYWTLVEEELKESYPEIFEIIDSVKNFKPNPDKEIKRYAFTTFHQSYAYEDFIEGIKPILQEDEVDGELNYRIEDGVFKELCKRAELDPKNRYAIFIDEINRANVSAVFGELITLIEGDKRKGAKNALSAILPYSKKSFSVPNNVDIYGTMNTADRSIEALDTALRRRFRFVEMMPNPELLNGKTVLDVHLKELLNKINERIEVLIDRDHTIGHAYLIDVENENDLKRAFKDKIIPLLQEYFFGDYGKIGLVLGSAFVEKGSIDEKIFSDFEYEGREGLIQTTYQLKNFDQIDFKAALAALVK